jgi:hypothetical protein
VNAFPLPNGPDLGNGTAAFVAGYSDPSTLDSSSVRIDYLPAQRVTVFGRYSNAPSRINQRGGNGFEYSNIKNSKYGSQFVTLGSNQMYTSHLTNQVRVNYGRATSHGIFTLDSFGGAIPPARFRFVSLIRLSTARGVRSCCRRRSQRNQVFCRPVRRQLADAGERH